MWMFWVRTVGPRSIVVTCMGIMHVGVVLNWGTWPRRGMHLLLLLNWKLRFSRALCRWFLVIIGTPLRTPVNRCI